MTSQSNPSTALAAAQKDPFRVFFPLGAAAAIAGVLPWSAQIFAVSGYPAVYHQAMMINGFMLAFVCGFLMTAVPRFTSSDYAYAWEIMAVFTAIFVGALLALGGHTGLTHLAAAVAISTLIAFSARRFVKRKENPPFTFIFVGCGLVLWLVANLGLFLTDFGVPAAMEYQPIWRDLFSNGAIMSLILGVGGRLVPGILGWQDIVSTQRQRYEGAPSFVKAVPAPIWLALVVYLASFALLEVLPQQICLGMRAAVVAYFALRYWQIYRAPHEKSYLTWTLWVSCWCLFIGSLLTTVWSSAYVHALHTSLIGGFSLIAMLVATRVTLAHSGKGREPEKTWRGILIFTGLIILAAVTRVTAILWPHYLHHLGYAALTWTVGFLLWAFNMVPRMLQGLRPASKR